MHYTESRARAALIHELLHLKYNEDEQRVRELCRAYFGLFKRKQIGKVSFGQSIYAMIFKTKSTEDKTVPRRETASLGMAVGRWRNPGRRDLG